MGKGIGEGAGRPTKYKVEYCAQVFRLALLGCKDTEMAKFFEVDDATFYRWQIDHPEFCEAVKEGKVEADGKVVASFYKRATGYQYREFVHQKVSVSQPTVVEGELTNEYWLQEVKTKELHPDAGACLNWLKNRRPADWRDKHEVDHTTNGKSMETSIVLSNGTRLNID